MGKELKPVRLVEKNMTEEKVQSQIVQYLKAQYPKVLFKSDMAGIKLPMGYAVKLSKLRSDKGFPDIDIFEPRRGYHGFHLELKRDKVRLFKKGGLTYSSPHIGEQAETHSKLMERGYWAGFACGFDEAKAKIDWYLKKSPK